MDSTAQFKEFLVLVEKIGGEPLYCFTLIASSAVLASAGAAIVVERGPPLRRDVRITVWRIEEDLPPRELVPLSGGEPLR